MPRPCCQRLVSPVHNRSSVFKPAGRPLRELQEIALTLDELEAMRLADLEGFYQEAAARRMEVSRQTFGRIVESARRKVTDAIVNQKALRIEGGPVRPPTTEKEQRMKVAVPTMDGLVDSHFGHCQMYTVFTLEKGAVVSEERVDSPQGCGCKSDIASTLARKGVTVLIAGGIGEGAVRALAANGLTTVRGASGSVREAAERFAKGQLADAGDLCQAHERACEH